MDVDDANATIERLRRRVAELEAELASRGAERALRESEARFRRLVEDAQTALYRYDLHPNRGFSYVSPTISEMLGYSPEEFYADPEIAWKLPHPEELPRLRAQRPPLAEGHTVTFRIRHRDGRLVWVERRRMPVYDDSGSVVAFEGIARDVTERKQAQGALQASEDACRQSEACFGAVSGRAAAGMAEEVAERERLEVAGLIAAQVAHDFDNLLSPLIAYPELIQRQLPPGHPALAYCQDMHEAALQMANINQDLLAMGRRGHVLAPRPTDLNRLIRQAMARTPDWSEGLSIDLDLAPDLLPVAGAPAQLLRAITNLVANAREAMQDRGVLTIKTENVHVDRLTAGSRPLQIGEYVMLTVRDTGCGIQEEMRERIFDPFFTTKATGERQGCGLGLSVVQAIAEDHHGLIDLESEVGKGTSFSLYLPVSRELTKEASVEELPRGRESLLVVDDDHLQREMLQRLLESLGYRVETAPSGDAAIDHLRAHPVDLLILDLAMTQGIDGLEIYRRALETGPALRVILLSGCAEAPKLWKALSLGAGTFLRKPVTLEKLARAVREELDQGA